MAAGLPSASAQSDVISVPADQLLTSGVTANQAAFYVYQDQDSGFNHGFPSGFFGTKLDQISIDTGCIDDPNAGNGCSADTTRLDRSRGTVLRVTFSGPLQPSDYVGVNIEEPENWGANRPQGNGYDFSNVVNLLFDVRSPTGISVQFGVAGNTIPNFVTIPASSTYTQMSIPLASMTVCNDPQGCDPLNAVHRLLVVVTNGTNAPNGGTLLLDNIRLDPVPTYHQTALGFPAGNQTFGALPLQSPATGRVPFPSDQVLRNLSTIYESAITELALLARGTAQDVVNVRLIADTFDYALHHDSHGDPLPTAPDGSVGLHNAYEDGDIALFNDQLPPKMGKAGDIRLAGFTASVLCAPSKYCLVLDDASGGNNAFAILALLAAYRQFNDPRYLNDALEIANWILDNLADNSGQGYGGYFAGYFGLNVGMAGVLNQGKSTENNADIFVAFTALAVAEAQLGSAAAADTWTAAANVAGDFVMRMFDPIKGRFNLGTVPTNSPPPPGPQYCPGPAHGSDTLNVCDFLDANTFPTLAMAATPRYQNQIDWHQPVEYVLNNFLQTSITAGGTTFEGFDLVPAPTSGPNGVAWEFTGQACVTMRFVDRLYQDTRFESWADSCVGWIQSAQTSAPFGDGQGLVASTLQGGDTLPPIEQCLSTPFQCIAERVGLAATVWAIFAEQNLNPFTIGEFTQVPGSLAQISVGSDGSVWGINSAGQIYWSNPQTQHWQHILGQLAQVAVASDGAVWGINSAQQVYRFNAQTQGWDPIPGLLTRIAVGSAGVVWGINSSQQIFRFDPGTQGWDQIPGSLVQIAVGADGSVWGLNVQEQIFSFDPQTQGWDQIPGLLTQIAVGSANAVWGINDQQQVFHFNPRTRGWDQIPGALIRVTVGANGAVWGINAAQEIFTFNPQTQGWEQIPGALAQIAVGADGSVWGINAQEQIFELNVQPSLIRTWQQIPGQLTQIAVGVDGAVWGINAAQQIFTFNARTQSWNQVPGLLAQMAVGFGGAVWGINAAQQIWRFNPQTQSWDQIPGALTQIAVGSAYAVWGINEQQQIFHYNPQTQSWDHVRGALVQIAVGADGTVCGINSAQQIFCFNSGSWTQLPGLLTQIAVGSADAVWGINAGGQVFRYNSQTQMWDQIPGQLTQITVAYDGVVWGINSAQEIFTFDTQAQDWDQIPGLLTQMAVGSDGTVWGINSSQQIFRLQ
jgi:hypothetical protein